MSRPNHPCAGWRRSQREGLAAPATQTPPRRSGTIRPARVDEGPSRGQDRSPGTGQEAGVDTCRGTTNSASLSLRLTQAASEEHQPTPGPTAQSAGANLPEDAIHPLNLADGAGKPLDRVNRFALHFDNGQTPPVNAFWSVTLYDAEGFQIPKSLNRFAVSSWMPHKYNADALSDLYMQNESPAPTWNGIGSPRRRERSI